MLAQAWGLWRDLRHGWKNSTRLSSKTAVTVTCTDVVSIAGVTITSVLCVPLKWKHIQQSLHHLIQVNRKLKSLEVARIQTNIIIFLWLLPVLIIISILDYYTWLYANKRNNLAPREDRGPINYSPIYLMYIVNTVFEIQYALIVSYMGKILEIINRILQQQFTRYKFHQFLKRIIEEDQKTVEKKISLLVNLHDDLLNSIRSLNMGFGLPILFAVLNCFIHLIITAYFAYIELHDDNCSWRILSMQIVWIIFHIIGLLIIVQPCYWCITMNKEIGTLICKLIVVNKKLHILKRLEVFSHQLLFRPLEFSVCGLFYIDRRLCTSIASAITTYLVILIQFQGNGDDN
ncbi:gustatory receptor for sugar taste 43a-like isoform X2 [Leptopilina heterotoma]|nr:gustatory receptor for sugar taste 43a-like isoform X2 [Leptopilina heterotoma]